MMSEEPQISPLRNAPVEMTSLFGNAKYCSQDIGITSVWKR